MMIIDLSSIIGTHGTLNTDSQYNFLFSIVVPVFNEEKIILDSLLKIKKFISQNQDSNAIFVDDGSVDQTLYLINKNLGNNIFITSHVTNKGYGSALKTGISYAKKLKSKYVVFLDSDMTNDLNDIYKFRKFMNLDFDIIKATRYEGKFNESKIPFKRFIISYIGNLIFKMIFRGKVTDATNGFRAIKVKHYSNIMLYDDGFSIIVEELFKFKNFKKLKIINIHVKLGIRDTVIKKSSFTYDIKTIFSYIKYIMNFYS